MNTYILSPNNANNYAVLQKALADFPMIASQRRVKYVFEKSDGDIVEDGLLLVAENPNTYIYLCAEVEESSGDLQRFLSELDSYSIYSIDTQPFDTYWL
jgi:hypothetical protein